MNSCHLSVRNTDEDPSGDREHQAEEKIDSLKEAIKELGFGVEDTAEGIRIVQE